MKDQILKVYEFSTIKEIAYVLSMKPTTISNFYHSLILPRDALKYVNIFQREIL